MSPDRNGELLTVKEAAHILRLAEKTIYRMLRDGRLSGKRFGRILRIDPKDLHR